MRAKITLSMVLLLCTLSPLVLAQSSSDYAVQLSATVQTNPPQITLTWPQVAANNHFVYRKMKAATSWGTLYASLPGNATAFIDTVVSRGISYEYRVSRAADGFSGFGYINAGIEIPQLDSRGGMILLVDSSLSAPLASEISRLQRDIEMDGWVVCRFDLSPAIPVDSVKTLIRQQYASIPGFIKAVFLLGHIAVPYSGNIGPDGHPDHIGAWPADAYYGDMNGIWTDNSIDNVTANDERNDNVPGDGKFDQSLLPSDIELQIGRVDFTNLPVYQSDAIALTKSYLDRNHAFRMRAFVPEDRAVIDDNFGGFSGEAFASGGYRNFSALVGHENIADADYRTTLSGDSHLLSYGCGGGSYTSCSGVGTSNDFSGDSLQTVFTMLFGSYFGDWDRQNNLLRAALAQGTTLAICWSGRPHWMFHHMGLGENIGYATRLTQNNNSLYAGNYGMRFIHIALLGDPTLRLHYISPPSEINLDVVEGKHVRVHWSAAADQVLGYRVFHRSDPTQPFIDLTGEVVKATEFIDSCMIAPGNYEYAVRSVGMTMTASGSYYNLSTGVSDTIRMKNDLQVIANFNYTLSGDTLRIVSNTSHNATEYYWDFGDGNVSSEMLPTHIYQDAGQYHVTLIASSECDTDSSSQTLDVLSATEHVLRQQFAAPRPNPATSHLTIALPEGGASYTLELTAISGIPVMLKRIAGAGVYRLEVAHLARGVYLLQVRDQNGRTSVYRVSLQ